MVIGCYKRSDHDKRVWFYRIPAVTSDVLESDLKVVLNTVAVDSYYESIVMKHFRSVLSGCNDSQASSLAARLAPHTESMLLCASLLLHNGEFSQVGLTQALAEKLNQSSTDFTVASYDPLTENFLPLVYKVHEFCCNG